MDQTSNEVELDLDQCTIVVGNYRVVVFLGSVVFAVGVNHFHDCSLLESGCSLLILGPSTLCRQSYRRIASSWRCSSYSREHAEQAGATGHCGCCSAASASRSDCSSISCPRWSTRDCSCSLGCCSMRQLSSGRYPQSPRIGF